MTDTPDLTAHVEELREIITDVAKIGARAANITMLIINAQAAEIARLREALEQIVHLSCNMGGWFEQDAWAAYSELGDLARAALVQP